MYVQPFYMVDIFHYDDAITSRIEEKIMKGSFGLRLWIANLVTML